LENLKFSSEDNIGIIKINRPDKLNALNEQTLQELNNLLKEIKENDSVYVVIITGSGEKAFVAGADIMELNKLDATSGENFAKFGQSVFDAVENLGKPVIAAVNGYALGGGCELALACHFRIASENAVFGQPELKLGVIPGYGGTQRLARQVNSGRALQIILTGEMVSAGDAEKFGLVNAVYPAEKLIDEAKKIAGKICSMGQIAVTKTLEAVLAGNDLTLSGGLKKEAGLFAACCGSNDFKEGTDAFLQKRAPHFTNK
jgi:enoyl-CoA hydratase